jgi:hypothetical protein
MKQFILRLKFICGCTLIRMFFIFHFLTNKWNISLLFIRSLYIAISHLFLLFYNHPVVSSIFHYQILTFSLIPTIIVVGILRILMVFRPYVDFLTFVRVILLGFRDLWCISPKFPYNRYSSPFAGLNLTCRPACSSSLRNLRLTISTRSPFKTLNPKKLTSLGQFLVT